MLTWPARTISTTSMVLSSVTRIPSTKWVGTCSLASIRLDLGPAAVHHHRVDAQILEHTGIYGRRREFNREGGLSPLSNFNPLLNKWSWEVKTKLFERGPGGYAKKNNQMQIKPICL